MKAEIKKSPVKQGFQKMAERKGLEPSASGVTGRRYNQLNYRSMRRNIYNFKKKASTFCKFPKFFSLFKRKLKRLVIIGFFIYKSYYIKDK